MILPENGAAVQPVAPLVEIPQAGGGKARDQAVFAAPPQEQGQDALRHGQQLPPEGEISARLHVLAQRGDKAQGKAGNGHPHPGRGAQLEQPVLPLAQRQKTETGRGEFLILEHIIAAEHLVAGIHGVQRLFPPGAVLVMLVHA